MTRLFERDRVDSGLTPESLIDAVRGLEIVELSDGALIDRVHELEKLIAVCGALQLRLGHRLHDRRLAAGRARLAAGRSRYEADRAARSQSQGGGFEQGRPTTGSSENPAGADVAGENPAVADVEALGRVTASTAREFGLARQESTATGRAWLMVADTVCVELPLTLAALEAGDTNLSRVRVVADAARKLPVELRGEFDRIVAPQLVGSTNLPVERKAKAAVYGLDPQGALARLRRSIAERGVSTRPVGDGLVRMSITAPLVGAIAAFAALRKAAEAARLSGDPRTVQQIMADESISRLTAGAITGCDQDGLPVRREQATERGQNADTVGPFDPVAEVNRRFREQMDKKNRENAGQTTDVTDAGPRIGSTVTATDSDKAEAATDLDKAAAATVGAETVGAETVGAEKVGAETVGAADTVRAEMPDSAMPDAAMLGDAAAGTEAAEASVHGADYWARWADQWVLDHPELVDYPDDLVPEPPWGEPEELWDESLLDDETLFRWLDRWNAAHLDPGDEPDVDRPNAERALGPITSSTDTAGEWGNDTTPAAVDGADLEAISVPGLQLKVHLHLILSDTTLLFGGDDPGTLIGHGPVPAHVARRLAALSEQAGNGPVATTIRRYVTDPVSGRLADCDPTAREFPPVLKEFLTTRDQECRGPWCGATIRHFDHVKTWATGGPTTKDNGQGLCVACNQIKESPGWTTTVDQETGTITTRTPTGHTYDSPERQPVIAR